MRFPGFWINGVGADVTLQFAFFDDTELTPESNWKLAYQNGDEGWPSGFVEPLEALRDVCARVGRRNGSREEPTDPGAGDTVHIRGMDDLARVALHLLDRDALALGRVAERAAQ